MTKQIPITDKAHYKWPDHIERWTEEYSGKVTVPKGTELYHSSNSYLEAFVPKETCFSWALRGIGHMYKVTLTKSVIGYTYDDNNEVRINIKPSNATIEYIGVREATPIRNSRGFVTGYKTEFIPVKEA